MTLSLNQDDVRASIDMGAMIDALEDAAREEYAGALLMPPRTNLFSGGRFLRVMPAFMTGSGLMGFKCFYGTMEDGVRYLVAIMQESDGELLALVDGAYLTAVRTGATSGVATRHLAPPGAATVGVIGSGTEAETNLAAIAAVRPVKSVRVYSPNPEKRAGFADRVGAELGLDITPVASAREAVADRSLVIVATNTGHDGPYAFFGEWLEPGQHVVSIGSTSPFLREIDPATFERAEIVVFDTHPEQFFEESGDLIAITDPALRERLERSPMLPQLVVEGIERGEDDITLFKSAGAAVQDIVAAKSVYESAVRAGRGRDLGELVQPKFF